MSFSTQNVCGNLFVFLIKLFLHCKILTEFVAINNTVAVSFPPKFTARQRAFPRPKCAQRRQSFPPKWTARQRTFFRQISWSDAKRHGALSLARFGNLVLVVALKHTSSSMVADGNFHFLWRLLFTYITFSLYAHHPLK